MLSIIDGGSLTRALSSSITNRASLLGGNIEGQAHCTLVLS
jgi:hypothetical protein